MWRVNVAIVVFWDFLKVKACCCVQNRINIDGNIMFQKRTIASETFQKLKIIEEQLSKTPYALNGEVIAQSTVYPP